MYFGTDEREVVPRWRSYEATLRNRELSPLRTRAPTPRPSKRESEVDLRLAEWREYRTPSYAADLLAAAVVLGDEEMIHEAATAIQRFGQDVPILGRSVAELAISTATGGWPGDPAQQGDATTLQPHISRMRRRLRRDQRNSIAWSELARFHAITGKRRSARRAMLVSLKLAPQSRFILRSAARLAVHLGEPDWGHHLLRASARTSVDPWLASAEISISALSGQRSRLVKVGRDMVGSARFSSLDVAELAAALGTREISTSRKRAKTFFARALSDPTENAVAQAVWASQGRDWLDIDPDLLEMPESYEARARTLGDAGERAAAIEETWHWMHDEPFAVEAPSFGSYQAAVGEHYEEGTKIAIAGLTANPDDFTLLNNAAFCFANVGRLAEAEQYFGRIKLSDLTDDDNRAVYFATRGLLSYRSGAVEAGRHEYTKSLRATKDHSVRAIAAIMFAREEICARTALGGELARQAFELEEAAHRRGGVMRRDVRSWLRQLQAVMAETQSPEPSTPTLEGARHPE